MRDSGETRYRKDIDGLRGFSILAVLMFHAFPSIARGGFVGVDIFFVISGFLITRIIMGSLKDGKFSFVQFYVRRINRIFPSLLIVLIFSMCIGYFIVDPLRFKELTKQIAAGAGFVANLAFLAEASYFDTSAELKPLLNLWSLGVEEQFYIFWPLILWLFSLYGFNLLKLMCWLCALSFFLNVYEIKSGDLFSFYSPQTRFWELIIGGILGGVKINFYSRYYKNEYALAHYSIEKAPSCFCDRFTLRINNFLSFCGLFLLILALIFIDGSSSFPGYWALLPVCGTMLLIYAGPLAWVNSKILSCNLLVWIGLISYPLYLWHWPILSFLRIQNGPDTGISATVAALLLSFALAWLTFKYIEAPIRAAAQSQLIAKRLSLFMLTIGMLSLYLYLKPGGKLEGNFSYGHDQFFSYLNEHYRKCEDLEIYENSDRYKNWIRCWQSKNGNPDVIILGDSHSEHLFVGVAESLPDYNVAYYIQAGIPTMDDPNFKTIFNSILNLKESKYIFLSNHYLPDYKGANSNQKLYSDFDSTIQALLSAGHRVALVGDVPRFPSSPENCLQKEEGRSIKKNNLDDNCLISLEQALEQEAIYEGTLKLLSAKYNVPFFSIGRLLCSNAKCYMLRDGILYYRDHHHLNVLGSRLFGSDLVKNANKAGFFDRTSPD